MEVDLKIRRAIRVFLAAMAGVFIFGTFAYAYMYVKPQSLNFGNENVGLSSAPRSVTITNANGKTVTITGQEISVPQFSYSGPAFPVSLKYGQSLTVALKFTPAGAKTYNGILALTRANGPAILIALSGTGTITAAPAISTQPSSVSVVAGQTATFKV
ncbi:MAG TPA: choice-of-anchor D domain-containing protein, partial [Candidatus Acidoferrales bacterium]